MSVSRGKPEEVGLRHLQDPEGFIEYSSDLNDVYSSTGACNPGKRRKPLTVFDDMITDMQCRTQTYFHTVESVWAPKK